MLSYPYIQDLFRVVLDQSSAIQGRFFIAPYWTSQLNSSNLEQLVDDSMSGNKKVKQYPLVLMMPPPSTADYTKGLTRDPYNVTMFFLKQTGVTSTGAVQAMSSRTGHTTHTIVEDWHDMKRCAVSFVRAIALLVTAQGLSQYFYISQRQLQTITPISTVGNDKLSGVKLDMTCVMNLGCNAEDYPSGFENSITIPTTDSHPKHPL